MCVRWSEGGKSGEGRRVTGEVRGGNDTAVCPLKGVLSGCEAPTLRSHQAQLATMLL